MTVVVADGYPMWIVHDMIGSAKNEATRTADRYQRPALVRVSPPAFSQERKRLMTIMPTGPDSAYPENAPCVEPHADGCPECVLNVEEPWHRERRADGCYSVYECGDCGHRWITAGGC